MTKAYNVFSGMLNPAQSQSIFWRIELTQQNLPDFPRTSTFSATESH